MDFEQCPIIAFGHQSRVGKDTCCKAIVEAIDPGAFQMSFATPLKEVSQQLFAPYGVRHASYYEGPEGNKRRAVELDKLGMNVMDIWIKVGMKMREIYPNIWADAALAEAGGDLMVLSDLRFMNEAEGVRARGGICVKVTRPDAPPPQASDNEFPPDFEWDFEIINDGTLQELQTRAVGLATEYIYRWQRRSVAD